MEFLDGVTLKHRIAGRPLDTETAAAVWPSRSPTRSTPRTPKASSIATSSRPTSSSPSAATPRFSTSDWPKLTVRQTRRRSQRPNPRPLTDGRAPHQSRERRSAPWRTCRRSRLAPRNWTARTDLFSFGAVLYEMATGAAAVPRREFGDDLRRDPQSRPAPAGAAQSAISRELEEIIDKALEKDRESPLPARLRNARRLQRLKRDTESGRISSSSISVTVPRVGRGWMWMPGALILV